MKAILIGIYDTKAETFVNVEPCPNKGVAIRGLTELVNTNKESPFHKWPEDYTLKLLGEIDMETGLVKPVTDEDGTYKPQTIVQLRDLKQ